MNIEKIFKTPLHIKIVAFFHENPSTIDTSRGIAAWIDHNLAGVEEILKYLTKMKILVEHKTRSTTGYAYTQDSKIMLEIDRRLRGMRRKKK